jgi:hypothetical protein
VARGPLGSVEEYCRHPEGLPLPPLPAPHHHLSQRALFLSVGALALSVVAMTTMFIFVYSHGSGALEAAAKASSRGGKVMLARERVAAQPVARAAVDTAGAAPAAQPLRGSAGSAPGERSLDSARASGDEARGAGAPALAVAPEHCTGPSHPLQSASAIELADGDGSLSVERHALSPSRSAAAYSGARAIGCE